ncbi:MAG: hypothetical protein IMW90_21655 [Thermogemmatispora sp.]|jgi:hypothetical protein|uniref:hypothetical protein n=1 Tax=Thermogemmatispora TaxID=768669 RepID=UPI00124D95A3|nr:MULTISPECIES: hypothetical protein [Thermogemmatispora]MBE3568333.1 hypothetical protein [Thermogemmatispora sp.]GER84134.1 hypothetical protein KTAU_27700 [Thermogemmatispora aurantia]
MMMNDSNLFFSPGQDDAEEWVSRYLRTVKDCLQQMRALLLYKVNLREIGTALLEGFDRELRSFLERLDTDPILKSSVGNTDAITDAIFEATVHINLAISLQTMNQSKNVHNHLHRLFHEYKKIADEISKIIDILHDIPSTHI